MSYRLEAIVAAYILDLIIGDPYWSWHPVRLIGRLIGRLETILNNEKLNKKFSGFILVILIVSVTALSVFAILRLGRSIHPFFYFIVYTLLIYFALSVKSLATEANKVYRALAKNEIVQARKNLSMIVARDTQDLNEPQIIRATVETVAESTMDGIVSPLFYAFLGGPVLVWIYKAVNTLDSMVGYKNERFVNFGRASAILDGILNFIPAKIASFVILIASYCCGKYNKVSGIQTLKYFLKGHRYNSETTEAVMASALGVSLGGVNFYNSVAVEKNLLGKNIFPLERQHIKDSVKIAYVSSVLFMVLGLSFIWLIERG